MKIFKLSLLYEMSQGLLTIIQRVPPQAHADNRLQIRLAPPLAKHLDDCDTSPTATTRTI